MHEITIEKLQQQDLPAVLELLKVMMPFEFSTDNAEEILAEICKLVFDTKTSDFVLNAVK